MTATLDGTHHEPAVHKTLNTEMRPARLVWWVGCACGFEASYYANVDDANEAARRHQRGEV